MKYGHVTQIGDVMLSVDVDDANFVHVRWTKDGNQSRHLRDGKGFAGTIFGIKSKTLFLFAKY